MTPPANVNDVRTMLAYYIGNAQTGSAARYTVRHGQTVIGICGFNDIDRADSRVEIGYEILPAYQHRGWGSALVAAMVDQAWQIRINGDAIINIIRDNSMPNRVKNIERT